jgi:AcrR family transcriptional regulator
LTRDTVLKTARAVLAERGLDGLTMRHLAARLGVAPNALYSHVTNKTALIDDLLDDVLADVETPAVGTLDAEAGLALVMTSAFNVLVNHPDLVPLYLARQGARGPNAQRLGDVMFDLLAAASVTGTSAHEARRVLIVFTIGFAALATPAPIEPEAPRPLTTDDVSGNFTSGLRWLLAGILGATEASGS